MSNFEEKTPDIGKTILNDKVMMYIHQNYQQIGVPPPVLYSDKPCYDSWGNEDVPEPLELDFIRYYTRFNGETDPMWLRIILRYFDQHKVDNDVMEYLFSSLQKDSSFWRFMDGVFSQYEKGNWSSLYPEIMRLLKKFGLKVPKEGTMIELMREIVE